MCREGVCKDYPKSVYQLKHLILFVYVSIYTSTYLCTYLPIILIDIYMLSNLSQTSPLLSIEAVFPYPTHSFPIELLFTSVLCFDLSILNIFPEHTLAAWQPINSLKDCGFQLSSTCVFNPLLFSHPLCTDAVRTFEYVEHKWGEKNIELMWGVSLRV